jgi:exopolysaccharide biosynthesis WecB/TagA/CpsF family protein
MREMERMRGCDFMLAVCELAARRGWSNYFYGGAEGTPDLLAARLQERFPSLRVAGTYSPPFRPLSYTENEEVVARINASNADLVWVGLSTPKQERWMARNRVRLDATALFGVGMAFDVHAGLLPQAPEIIQRSGFEWLYRLRNDPRRLWRRYMYNNPRFLMGVMRRPPRLSESADGISRRARSAPAPRGSLAKRISFRMFRLLERTRLHLLPVHFYSSVADRGWLERNPDLWREPASLPGVQWDLEAQLAWLRSTCAEHLGEVAGFSFVEAIQARGVAFRYGLVEGQVLHCVIRSLAPELIVEVGSGASTCITADAIALNVAQGGTDSRVIAIDPFAPPELCTLDRVEVVAEPAQTVAPETFAQLRAGDLLFIDTTHVVKAGSELGRLYLEVLPSLPAGVTIHIHDIYLPYLYSPWILSDPWDWQESTLLAALLTSNARFEVLCCQAALHDAMPDRLRGVLPDYRPLPLDRGIDHGDRSGHYPSSIWLRTR